MPVFAYSGLSPEGRNVRGIVDAENARAARLKLRRSGVFPTALNETEEGRARKLAADGTPGRVSSLRLGLDRVTPQDLAILTRQLSTLVGAGLPLVESIGAL